MKYFKIIILLITIQLLFLTSCNHFETLYPRYSLYHKHHVPDSLKVKHSDYVNSLVKSASFHMTGGDYERADKTIYQAKRTADELYRISELCLIKQYNEYDNEVILVKDFNNQEKNIFEILKDNGKQYYYPKREN